MLKNGCKDTLFSGQSGHIGKSPAEKTRARSARTRAAPPCDEFFPIEQDAPTAGPEDLFSGNYPRCGPKGIVPARLAAVSRLRPKTPAFPVRKARDSPSGIPKTLPPSARKKASRQNCRDAFSDRKNRRSGPPAFSRNIIISAGPFRLSCSYATSRA